MGASSAMARSGCCSLAIGAAGASDRHSSQHRSRGARERGLHKLSLSVFPHNEAGIALYREFKLVVEGRHLKQSRRSNGELWDLIDMGLLLTTE